MQVKIFRSENYRPNKMSRVLFFNNYKVSDLCISRSYSETILKVQVIWARAKIHKKRKDKLTKLKNLHSGDWIKLFKSRFNRKSPTPLCNESIFLEGTKNIFDISCEEVEQFLMEEQRFFLVSLLYL